MSPSDTTKHTASSSFKDRLAQWNIRDANTDARSLDVARLGNSKKNREFLALGARRHNSIIPNDSSHNNNAELKRSSSHGSRGSYKTQQQQLSDDSDHSSATSSSKGYSTPTTMTPSSSHRRKHIAKSSAAVIQEEGEESERPLTPPPPPQTTPSSSSGGRAKKKKSPDNGVLATTSSPTPSRTRLSIKNRGSVSPMRFSGHYNKEGPIGRSKYGKTIDDVSLGPLQAAKLRVRRVPRASNNDNDKTQSKTTKKRAKNNIRATPLQEAPAGFVPPIIPKDDEALSMIRSALSKNFIFQSLDPSALQKLVDAFETTPEFKLGDRIIQQGDEGDYFYVIRSGSVDFLVNETKVGSANAGASFGELALLYTCPRAATVLTASAPTICFRVHQTTFRYILQSQTKESKRQKMLLLKNIDFFQQLETNDLEQCCRVMTPRKYEAGDVIVAKGEAGDAFYIVQEGQLRVTDIVVGNTKYEDVPLGPGSYFGERALVKSEPRAANVIGVTPGILFSIDRATFENICGSFVRLIMKSVDKSRLSGVKIIQAVGLSQKKIEDLARTMNDTIYSKGKVLFSEGKSIKPALYLVREGQFRIRYSNGDEKIIHEGGYFGEDQLQADSKSNDIAESMIPRIKACYTATAMEDKSICGVLRLSDCRKIFDTTKIPVFDLEEEEAVDEPVTVGVEKKDEPVVAAEVSVMEVDHEFADMVGQRQLRRSSLNMEVLRSSLERQRSLGEGQFGEVWEVSANGEEFEEIAENFALKIQSKSAARQKGTAIEAIERECKILASLDHPYIVDLVHSYEDKDYHYMVMGLIQGGDLWSVIHTEDADGEWHSGVPEVQAKFFALVIADTLDYIHRQLITYRDMKPENIMVDHDGYPIIVDFGFAKQLKDKSDLTYTFCGTPNYVAPELIRNHGHSFACDHWALAVVICEMIGGENPFAYDGIDHLTLFNDICNESPYPLPDECSKEVNDLLDGMLVKDPAHRLGSLAGGSKDIKEHEWFSGLDLALIRQRKLKAPYCPPTHGSD